jgi:hypothetical protein
VIGQVFTDRWTGGKRRKLDDLNAFKRFHNRLDNSPLLKFS